jgi:rubrerythrin
MDFDERGLRELLDHSDDAQADAMRASRDQLAEVVELGQEQRAHGGIDPEESTAFKEHRSRLLARGAAGVGLGAAIIALSDSVAFAGTPSDVQILQTAASIENLAIATYTTALGLSFIGGVHANAVVKDFVVKTRAQHREHAAAFNSSIKSLGGKEQTQPDPVLLELVKKAEPGLTSPVKVVELAITLETGAAETYVKDTAALKSAGAKNLTASIMGVEAQHVAILLAVKALLEGGAAADITLPPPLAKLPAAAGSVGFPNSFYPTTAARPATEGAVK